MTKLALQSIRKIKVFSVNAALDNHLGKKILTLLHIIHTNQFQVDCRLKCER